MFQTPGEAVMDAMGVADWVRGGLVQEALADAAVRSAAAEPGLADMVRKDQDAKNEIAALRKYLAGDEGGSRSPLPEVAAQMRQRIALLDTQRLQWQTDIRARFPGYDRLVRPVPPTASDVANALEVDEALVMLLPTDNAVYAWAVTRSGPGAAVRVAMPKAELGKLVQDMRKTLDFSAMGNRIVPFNTQAASTLYQRLMAPLAQATADKKHLIIAAGGALGQIPFGVLLTDKPSAVAKADQPWLIRQAAITHIPSLSAWMAVKQFARAAPAPQVLAAWGDPQFRAGPSVAVSMAAQRNIAMERPTRAADLEQSVPGALRYSDIPPLPETRDELLAIAAALQSDPSADLHLGAAATRASVLQSSQGGELAKKKVVVFATHGLMAGDLPGLMQPALALANAGAATSDALGALLTLDDVLSLKLNADWVLLSACNTAAADGRAEEALSGLARGFFYAGSRSLLVTHWAVDSNSASLLTTNALRSWTTHPAERKAESLRQSMLQVMRDPQFGHPAFWAPYALVGDGAR
jgi:CHAT domain-containing protein